MVQYIKKRKQEVIDYTYDKYGKAYPVYEGLKKNVQIHSFGCWVVGNNNDNN